MTRSSMIRTAVQSALSVLRRCSDEKGTFDLRRRRHVIVAATGALLMSVMLARAFGRFYGGL